jgi:hypothetical protein
MFGGATPWQWQRRPMSIRGWQQSLTAESEKPTPMVVSVEFVRAIDGRPAPPDLPANVARLPLAKTG